MMLTDTQIDALIEAVRTTAKAEIVPLFRALDVTDIDAKSAPDDLVTIADKASEAALTAAARQILPESTVIGEEAVAADAHVLDGLGDGQVVIIDPIDGTWNYANGIATYGVILAVVEAGETVFGLLYDPSYDDWIMAKKGAGTWFCTPDASPRRLSTDQMPDALDQAFGFVGMYLFQGESRARIAAELPKFRRTMTLRCSCHEYRLLTEGRAQFCINGMLNPWDHAAGVLCLEEAGGVARLFDGTPYAPTMTKGHLLTAGSQALWDKLARRFSFLA